MKEGRRSERRKEEWKKEGGVKEGRRSERRKEEWKKREVVKEVGEKREG